MRILIVEDSERLRRSLREGLHGSGFAVDVAADGEMGLAFARSNDYAVVVLDLMLPKLDGMSVLKQLRQFGSTSPVLILSAKDEIADRVHGLNVGADDYLVKPFAFEELLARIHALLRRGNGNKTDLLRAGHIELDAQARLVRVAGTLVTLTRLEFSLLELLMRRRGRILSRQQIIDQIYPATTDHESNVLDVLVYGLRKKIQPGDAPDVIITRRGLGYLIEAG